MGYLLSAFLLFSLSVVIGRFHIDLAGTAPAVKRMALTVEQARPSWRYTPEIPHMLQAGLSVMFPQSLAVD
jgi:hypothetical protein